MVNDPNPSLRAEMEAAINNLVPQVRGLTDFSRISISAAAVFVVNSELTARQRRLDFLNAVIASLDAVVLKLDLLYADGYPTFQPNEGAAAVFAEIQEEEADLVLAANLFRAGDVSIGLDLNNIVHTPQPVPHS